MFNRKQFEIQMLKADVNQTKLAELMGVQQATISRKMKTGYFTSEDMNKLIDILKIESPKRFYNIFFSR